jgi:hypothetical protein
MTASSEGINKEDRRIALTYLEAYLAEDKARMDMVLEVMSPDQLLTEIASISVILAGTLSIFTTGQQPPTANPDPQAIFARLRHVSGQTNA